VYRNKKAVVSERPEARARARTTATRARRSAPPRRSSSLRRTRAHTTPPPPPLSPPPQIKDLKKGIAAFYDESSALWEDVWGSEHMHHG